MFETERRSLGFETNAIDDISKGLKSRLNQDENMPEDKIKLIFNTGRPGNIPQTHIKAHLRGNDNGKRKYIEQQIYKELSKQGFGKFMDPVIIFKSVGNTKMFVASILI